ncbi:shikimate dehydrogenase [Planococcus donghaensis MPA1U2]|uniref:Shikimate dehydrogenase (NADP(+)) n=1 Tax=Planococcus donghaensis MPA1U2 TaxID=933115 RepID=E7RIQ1_9BACL|nr:shikimate dehydrogenase [Planococcus donghaensis]EGA89157.1 shikimate dehydrogenase [Planococcus donghaensis MPA1U2]
MKKWYAVIGDPISHSLSPFMHETWFAEHDIDAAYLPLHVEPAQLEKSFEAMKTLGISGFNITLPHKQSIVPLLGKLEENAMQMNAVNTVNLVGAEYTGSNTDGDGFVRSLLVHSVDKASKVLLIGAGGAARGIAFALKRAGFTDVTITNRTYRRAEELAADTNALAITLIESEERLADFAILIQTTSVGLATGEALPISLDRVEPETVVADIIYNPLETPFLKKAQEKNCVTVNGVGMFVYQGAIAFEKWTGIQPNTEKMIELITEKLGGTYVNN